MSNFLKIPGEKIDISTFDQFFMRQIQSGAEQIAIIHSSDEPNLNEIDYSNGFADVCRKNLIQVRIIEF